MMSPPWPSMRIVSASKPSYMAPFRSQLSVAAIVAVFVIGQSLRKPCSPTFRDHDPMRSPWPMLQTTGVGSGGEIVAIDGISVLLSRLEETPGRVAAAVAGRSATQLAQRMAAEEWSVLSVLAHMRA